MNLRIGNVLHVGYDSRVVERVNEEAALPRTGGLRSKCVLGEVAECDEVVEILPRYVGLEGLVDGSLSEIVCDTAWVLDDFPAGQRV